MSDLSIIAMVLIIVGGIGLTINCIVTLFPLHKKRKGRTAGTIVINTTDPKKDVIRIELDVSVGELMSMEKAIFQIENEDS